VVGDTITGHGANSTRPRLVEPRSISPWGGFASRWARRLFHQGQAGAPGQHARPGSLAVAADHQHPGADGPLQQQAVGAPGDDLGVGGVGPAPDRGVHDLAQPARCAGRCPVAVVARHHVHQVQRAAPDGGQVVGVVSIRDVARVLLAPWAARITRPHDVGSPA
jgi:hypothetical protein